VPFTYRRAATRSSPAIISTGSTLIGER
jgi:hypothetical protein